MKAIRLALSSFLFIAFFASASMAQLQRSFVSGGGNDANTCSRTAPCRTFTHAISQTNSAGEVYVLDTAGYGAFTITKPISIVAPTGVEAGISVFSGDGIDINAGSSDTVILRGLTVNNQGSTGNGIVVNSGAVIHVESCIVNAFANGVTTGIGLAINGHGSVEVKDSIFRGNDQGISVQPASGTALVTIDQCRLEASPSHNGLIALDGSTVTVRNTVSSANMQDGFDVISSTSRSAELNIENCVASNNFFNGIETLALSSGAVIARVSNSMITDNAGTGLVNAGGSPAMLLSRKNNTVQGNGSGATSGTIGSYLAQ